MIYLLAIFIIIMALAGYYCLIKKPEWLLACYLIAVPALPPLPVGSIELSALDYLTIPTLIFVIYTTSRDGMRIRGWLPASFFLYVLAALISFVSFTFQHAYFSVPIMLRLIRLVEMLLPVILAFQLSGQMKKDYAIVPFLIGGGLAAAIAIVMYAMGISMRPSQTLIAEGELIFRAAGTHGNSGSFGTLMGLSTLISVWVLMYARDFPEHKLMRGLKIIGLISGCLTFIALVTSSSRGGFVLFALGVLVLMAPQIFRPGRLLKLLATGLIVVLLIAGVSETVNNNQLITFAWETFRNRITGLSDLTTDFEAVSSHRPVFWNMGWQLYKSNPPAWALGLGYKSLGLHYNIPPDNNFNQGLFEMGILGIVALLIMISFGIRAGFQRYRLSQRDGILILALWFGLISNMLSADVITYWHNIPALFIILVAHGSRSSEDHTAPAEKMT